MKITNGTRPPPSPFLSYSSSPSELGQASSSLSTLSTVSPYRTLLLRITRYEGHLPISIAFRLSLGLSLSPDHFADMRWSHSFHLSSLPTVIRSISIHN